jgi:hypothetical protein
MLGHIGNADQTPVYFDMPSNVTVNENGAKTVLIRGTGNEKARITVMLGVLAMPLNYHHMLSCGEKRCPKISCQRA